MGNDASSNKTTYADIVSVIADPSASAEVGELRLRCISGASIQNTLCLKGKNVGIGTITPTKQLDLEQTSATGGGTIALTAADTTAPVDGDYLGQIYFRKPYRFRYV